MTQQEEQTVQSPPSEETLYGYLTAHIEDHSLLPYRQLVGWMTEKGRSINDLDNLLEVQWMGYPYGSEEELAYKRVYEAFVTFQRQCTLPEQCHLRRLLPCPSKLLCREKMTEHMMFGDYWECLECGCRQHYLDILKKDDV